MEDVVAVHVCDAVKKLFGVALDVNRREAHFGRLEQPPEVVIEIFHHHEHASVPCKRRDALTADRDRTLAGGERRAGSPGPAFRRGHNLFEVDNVAMPQGQQDADLSQRSDRELSSTARDQEMSRGQRAGARRERQARGDAPLPCRSSS